MATAAVIVVRTSELANPEKVPKKKKNDFSKDEERSSAHASRNVHRRSCRRPLPIHHSHSSQPKMVDLFLDGTTAKAKVSDVPPACWPPPRCHARASHAQPLELHGLPSPSHQPPPHPRTAHFCSSSHDPVDLAWAHGCVGAWVRGCVDAWASGCVGRFGAVARGVCARARPSAPVPLAAMCCSALRAGPVAL